MRQLIALGMFLMPASLLSQSREPLVEFENMTWAEVKEALAAGKTTALYYTGGTEQRGPQNVNGGHNYMARATVKAIALALGNAIAMPVLPAMQAGIHPPLGVTETAQPALSIAWIVVVPIR